MAIFKLLFSILTLLSEMIMRVMRRKFMRNVGLKQQNQRSKKKVKIYECIITT